MNQKYKRPVKRRKVPGLYCSVGYNVLPLGSCTHLTNPEATMGAGREDEEGEGEKYRLQ